MSQVANAIATLTLEDRAFQQAAGRVRQSMQGLQQTMERVGRVARNMLLVGGGAIAGFIKLASDQEDATRRLEAALDANGDSVERWSGRLLDASNRIQGLTTHGNESIQMLFAQARNMGIAADQLEATAEQAIGLSRAFDMDLNQALRAAVQANQGHFTLLQRYMPQIRQARDETEALAMVTEAAARGFEQEQAATETLSGQMAQLRNELGDVAKEIGGAFLPAVVAKIREIRELTPEIERWVVANQQLIVDTVKTTAALLALLVVIPKVAAALTFLAAHPVIAAMGGLAIGIAGVTAALNDGYVMGVNFGRMLEEIGKRLGIFSDAFDRLEAANRRAQAAGREVIRLEQEIADADTTDERIQAQDRLRRALLEQGAARRQVLREELQQTRPTFMSDEAFQRQLDQAVDADPIIQRIRQGFSALGSSVSQDLTKMMQEAFEETARLGERMQEAEGTDERVAARRALIESYQLQVELQELAIDRAREFGGASDEWLENAAGRVDFLNERLEEMNEQLGRELRRQSMVRGFEAAKAAAQDFFDRLREEFQKLEDARAEFMDRLELFGEDTQTRQLIMLERQRQALIDEAEQLGILTDEMREQIEQRAQQERERITGDVDFSGGDVQRSVDARVEGLDQVFRRIAEASASPSGPEERTAVASEKAAEAGEKTARNTEQTQRTQQAQATTMQQILTAVNELRQGLPLVGTFGA